MPLPLETPPIGVSLKLFSCDTDEEPIPSSNKNNSDNCFCYQQVYVLEREHKCTQKTYMHSEKQQ